MKKLLIIILAFASLQASAQTKVFCLAPSCKQTITSIDSATIFAQLTTSDAYGFINWKQVSGPSIIIPPQTVTWQSGLQAISSFTVGNLPAGTYIFSATGGSAGGLTGSVLDTLQVNPPVRKIAYVLTVYSDSTRIKNQ